MKKRYDDLLSLIAIATVFGQTYFKPANDFGQYIVFVWNILLTTTIVYALYCRFFRNKKPSKNAFS